VQVAAILHNRLLKYDNFDKFDWEKMDPNGEEYFEDEEPDTVFEFQILPHGQDLAAVANSNAADSLFPDVQPACYPLENQMDDVEDVEELPNAMREQLQWVFKDALRKHLSYAYSNGQIQ